MVGLRAVVALSGGVDSAVAGYLAKIGEGGLQLIGAVHSTNWSTEAEGVDEVQRAESCDAVLRDAELVAKHLDVPLLHADFEADYCTQVMQPITEAVAAGASLNPDCECNRLIKFSSLKDLALDRFHADVFVTGHYARNTRSEGGLLGRHLMHPVAWRTNDQSYFLASVPLERLDQVVFPLGSWASKVEVREFASRVGLPMAKKPTSTGICFVGRRKFDAFILGQVRAAGFSDALFNPGDVYEDLRPSVPQDRLEGPHGVPGSLSSGAASRPIRDAVFFQHGEVHANQDDDAVAQHAGIARYTVGQKIHLRRRDTGGVEAAFITARCPVTNRIFVVRRRPSGGNDLWRDSRLLYRSVRLANFTITDVNLWQKCCCGQATPMHAVLRHLQEPIAVRVSTSDTSAVLECLKGKASLFRAPSIGQLGVVYTATRNNTLAVVAHGTVAPG